MYCGCNKMALSSLNNISESFVELLKEKEYSKISISEICERADVSRQTFYSLFKSKENIISFELLKNYYFDAQKECSGTRPTVDEISRSFSEYIISKEEFIRLLEKNNIMYFMQDSLYESLICCCKNETEDTDCELIADLMAANLTTIAKHYVQHTADISKLSLNSYIKNILTKFECHKST